MFNLDDTGGPACKRRQREVERFIVAPEPMGGTDVGEFSYPSSIVCLGIFGGRSLYRLLLSSYEMFEH